jgi:hypothetical protein
LRVLLTQATKQDLDTAALEYEKQSKGRGSEFLDSVAESLRQIEIDPLAGRNIVGHNRCCLIQTFPYALWFRVVGETIVIGYLQPKVKPKPAREGALIPFPAKK